MNKEINSQQLGRTYLVVGSLALATTYLASRGVHSSIHLQIAKVALHAETITTLSGIGLLKPVDDKSRTALLIVVGALGLGVTGLCHAAVALTDNHLVEFRQAGKNITNPADLTSLGNAWLSDTKRHLRDGIRTIVSRGPGS